MPLLRTEPDWGCDRYAALHHRYLQKLEGALAHTFHTPSSSLSPLTTKRRLEAIDVDCVSLGGSSALDGMIQRPAHDLDMYLWGYDQPEQHDSYQSRQRTIIAWLYNAASRIPGCEIKHVYSQNSGKPPVGLQKILLKVQLPPEDQEAGHKDLLLKIEVHHECERNFLPHILPDTRNYLPRLDPRMVAVQKLSRGFSPNEGFKPVDIWDLHFFLQHQPDTQANRNVFRKLALASLASEGALRQPIMMDGLLPCSKQDIQNILESLKANIPQAAISKHLGSSEDAQHATLAAWISDIQAYLRAALNVRESANLSEPAHAEALMELSDGEQRFLQHLHQGKKVANTTIVTIDANALCDDLPATPETHAMIQRIMHDNGLLRQQAITKKQLATHKCEAVSIG